MLIELDRVSKRYAAVATPVAALTDVSLRIEHGSVVAVVGPSGSGKTTLLGMIGGLDRPTTGSVRVGGAALEGMAPRLLARFRLAHIGFMFQGNNLIDVLTAAENIALPLSLRRVAGPDSRRRVDALVEELGLREVAARRPCELSGGQQQRVSLARALVTEPSIVLADEPTAHLDAQTALEVMRVVRTIHERRGTTLIFSTHDAAVEAVATERCVLRSGRVVAEPRTEEIAAPCENWRASLSATSSVALDAR